MALYREGKAAMAADGTVTGTGTKWQSSLSLIRPGATIMFLSSPIQMAVVNKVVSDTEIKAITTNGAVVASSDYAILLSDSLTVDGLAQDVAETLRYYQSQETEIADAVDFFKSFDFEALQSLADQVMADSEAAGASASAAAASEVEAKTSETNAKASEVAAESARDQVQQIINDAGEQSTLVALAQPGGYSKIGQVPSFEALKSIQPYSGQRILIAGFYSGETKGNGEFVGVAGSAEDVPGQIAVVNANWYWKRITQVVKTSDCGLRKSLRANVTAQSGELFDVSDDLQKIISYANKNHLEFMADDTWDPSNPGFEAEGYYITKGIAFDLLTSSNVSGNKYVRTGMKRISGNLVLLLNSNNFTGISTPEGPFAVTHRCGTFNSEGKYYFGTLNTSCVSDNITVRDCSTSNGNPGRAVELSGILWMTMGFNYKQLTAYGFNGHSVRNFSYDGIAQSTRGEQGGNINKFSIYSSSYPYADRADESNAISFIELFAHNSFEKSWFVAGTKTSVGRFHDEALTCTIDSPPNPFGIESRNGYGYTSAYFSSMGGKLGTGTFSTFKDTTVTPVFTIGVISNRAGTIATGGCRVSVISGDPGPQGGSIGTISNIGGETRIAAGARVTIAYSRSETLLLLDPDSRVLAGVATSATTCYGKLERFSAGALTVNTAGVVDGCTCTALTVNSSGQLAVNIEKLRCTGDANITSKTYRSFIKNSWFTGTLTGPDNGVYDLENCTIHNLALGDKSGMNVNIKGGVFDTAVISSGIYLDPVPSFNFSLGGFTAPVSGTTGGAIGRKTTDPNTGVTYMCVGNSVWKKSTYS